MAVCLVTGCLGLIGSEAVRQFHAEGYKVVGIDNNSRKSFFGEEGNNETTLDDFFDLREFEFIPADLRNYDAIKSVFETYGTSIEIVIHTASLPAHDTCDLNPYLAYSVNVTGTFNVLELTKIFCPNALFIFTSSSKVYGNRHSSLDYIELDTRYDFDKNHELYDGIPETWNPDSDDRSMLGSTKLAADVLCQQFALTYGIRMGIWRPGTLTAPAHAGTMQHGFLSYLTKCAITKTPYIINGYNKKQLRDVWHSYDVVNAFKLFVRNPKQLGIWNIGGSRHSNVSMMEAINVIEEYTGEKMNIEYNPQPRKADHLIWIGSANKFLKDYPSYTWKYTVEEIIKELVDNWKVKLNG